MAQRKRWQSALAGLGKGIGDASQMMLAQSMRDRYDEKIGARQKAADDRQYVEELLKAGAKGEMEPSQIIAQAESRGIKLPPQFLESIRPSETKRLGMALDKPLLDAKSPEDLYDDNTIASVARGLGAVDQNQPPSFATEGMEPQSGAFAGLSKSAVDYGQRYATKRKALEAKPTERAETQDPITGAKSLQFVSPYAGSVQTTPTSEQQGVLAGKQKVSELNTAGPAEAEQAGREATATTTATQGVMNSPANVKSRVDEAIAKKRGELAAELAQSGLSEQEQRAALQLSDDFATQSKPYYDVSRSFRNIATLSSQIANARKAGKDSPASHIGLVYNFMKLQDPGSTVMQGEQATAQNARGVSDYVRNLYNSIVLGGRLTDEQVKDFAKTAGGLYQSAKADHTRRIQDFSNRATQFHVPPSLVVREPDPALDALSVEESVNTVRGRKGGGK